MNAMQTRCTYSRWLSLSSLSPSPSLYTYLLSFYSRTAFLPSGPLFFSILTGFGGYLALLYFDYCFGFFHFFGFGSFLASGGTRVLEPLRDTSVISKSDLGHSPCPRGGIGFFIVFLLLLGSFVANRDLFFKPSCSFFWGWVRETKGGQGGPGWGRGR